MSPEDQPVAHTEDSTISSSSINQNEDCVSGNQEREDDDVTYGSTDGGYGWVIAIAACLIEMPCMTMIWQLYMTFGVLYGTGSSIVFYNVLAILPLWFTKRRGVALAVASSGAPIGGFVFPPIINALITNATYLGIDTDRGSALLSIFSGTNLIGRFLAGALADTIGHVNTLIIYTMLTSFGCFFLWMFATDFATLSAAAAVCGFFAGTFLTLTSSITAIVTTLEKLEGGISLFLVLTTVSMFGPSFAGAIEQRVSSDFLTYKIFTGSGYLAGALILISMKLCLVRSLTKKI
ncbi:hypothetical protein BCR43DRAFT_536187 [Syncephalastrum racemosum]|uniref:Major facilitator superfamily (MFS) profile domain-containing protein n=1 Tax=Syncephalastrum racemosum TaxID=13706 RepID=A0A1X2HVG8_SYNRA|nr:hypothetical protein BCR43DRAFT_536187 [Syncephalastrum racemosum]